MEAPTMTPSPSPSPAPGTVPMYVPPPAPSPAPGSTAPGPAASMPVSGEPDGKMGNGGTIREFFADINLLDVALSAIITGTLFYMIYYYKFQVYVSKTNFADLNGRLSKVESSIEAAKKKAEANAIGSGSRQRKRGLVGLR